MLQKYSETWSNYTEIVDKIKKINKYDNKYKDLKKQLFETYELYFNMNNTIEPRAIKSVLKKWLSLNCYAMTDSEKEIFINNLDYSKFKMVRQIVDFIIEELFVNYCCLSCSENMVEDCKQLTIIWKCF